MSNRTASARAWRVVPAVAAGILLAVAALSPGCKGVEVQTLQPVVEPSTPDAELRSVAIADAAVLLGVPIDPDSVEGWARVAWDAPLAAPVTDAEEARVAPVAPLDGVHRVGGAVAGRGLAAVIAQSRATAAALLSGGVGQLAARSD